MRSILHQEFDVTVVAVRPWGLEVEFQGGIPGLIDNTKDPDWATSGRNIAIGSVVRAVVIDDERDPVRLSALDIDLEIARAKREATGD